MLRQTPEGLFIEEIADPARRLSSRQDDHPQDHVIAALSPGQTRPGQQYAAWMRRRVSRSPLV
jgi:hypothetical protein